MDQPTTPDLERSYEYLLNLWTSGVRDYHSLISGYLTANSIFVAAIGLLVSRQPTLRIFSVFIVVLCIFGLVVTLQMAIVLGRFDLQNSLWEWRLRGIERTPGWNHFTPFGDLYTLKDQKTFVTDQQNTPIMFHTNWAFRVHRRWWAHRSISFPLFFGIIYLLFLAWSIAQLLGARILI
ncbi:MAG: hypothetical protein HYX72_12170 [Acidobacteria bacterium]|nr:hypothetical protein [Acidobacteriota bacterium]